MANALSENILNPKQALQDAQETVLATIDTAKTRAQERVELVKESGIDRAFGIVESSLKITRRWATAGNLQTPEKRIQKALADVRAKRRSYLAPNVDAYDELNVKEVTDALDELTRVELQKARRYEIANKNRKTVLTAIDKRLA